MRAEDLPPKGSPVGVFPTCVVMALRPAVFEATCTLLDLAGYDPVLVAQDACCGQPAYSAGLVRDARKVAESSLTAIASFGGSVVVPSGSCAAMMRKVWPRLFSKRRTKLQADSVSTKTWELTEFLDTAGFEPKHTSPTGDTAGASRSKTQRNHEDRERRVTVHDSCHGLRELGLGPQLRRLLRAAGFEVVECQDADLCCGFGGVFSQLLPEVSAAMARKKLEALEKAAELATGTDLACLMHLVWSSAEAGSLPVEDSREPRASSSNTRATRLFHAAELLAGSARADSVSGK